MDVALITGAGGLVGAECCRQAVGRGFKVVAVENDMRRTFFGEEASTARVVERLRALGPPFDARVLDVRDAQGVDRLFAEHGSDIKVVIHAAAQPSHEWAAKEPATDFAVNATGTLNVLEATRAHCPKASFIFPSSNRVYGDFPNQLPLQERETRFEVSRDHPFAADGIDESMGIDQTLHSLFGVSKAAADLLVQEYGRYFGMSTVCFRIGCLTGPGYAGPEVHGFLAYLMKCLLQDRPYTVYGYKGKQVRDHLHCADLVAAFWEFHGKPVSAAVYNLGGGRHANCSVLEAIAAGEQRVGRKLRWTYDERSRVGDHIWYVSNTAAFEGDYPNWKRQFDMEALYDAAIESVRDNPTPTRAKGPKAKG